MEFLESQIKRAIGLLLFDQKIPDATILHQEILSSTGSLEKAASNFYSALHRLDNCKLDVIIAERFPDAGLGKTINDRLERATKNASGHHSPTKFFKAPSHIHSSMAI